MAATKESNNGVYLPADLVNGILLKLTVKSIIRFNCVAKDWMSSDSWRVLKTERDQLDEDPDLNLIPNIISNVCVNGVCYWQVLRNDLSRVKVLAFHLDSEVFQLIESPNPETGLGALLFPLPDLIMKVVLLYGILRIRIEMVHVRFGC
ncbi:F-box protein [Corchorus olitorius]|uniref:F-box protein n=1 Tax=Corchorus olitorius TaxID=93759 RepID=A0A1R3IF04_9ROSI|nr:F-box protein [Corchorus olitorius]